MSTLPIACACKTSAGTTLTNYLKVLYDFIIANGGLIWSIVNLVGGASPTSFTIQHTSGFQINLRSSGSSLLGLVARTGGITDSATPGTPANSLVETIFFSNASAPSVRINIALYATSIFFAMQNTGFTHFVSGFMAGKGRAVRGVNQFFQFCNVPNAGHTSAAGWFTTTSSSTTAARPSRVQFGAIDAVPSLCNGAASSRATLAESDTDRIAPCIVGAIKAANTINEGFPIIVVDELGFDMKQKSNPLVLVSSAGSNQAWMYFDNSNTPVDSVLLWDKTVDPTVPT